jgi:hypothetical protein
VFIDFFAGVTNNDFRMLPLLNDSLNQYPSILEKYQGTARLLHKLGCYKGLTTAIECCFRNENTFMIIDCPSGTGKTLAGVALSLLDHRQNPEASIGGVPVAVVHLVWPDAIGCQPIYQEIVKQTKVNDLFFNQALTFNFATLNGIKDPVRKEQYVRENLLGVLFPGLNTNKNSLLVIIDEVPEDPVDVKHVGEIREALKLVKNLCLVLSGTNSKASNMLGLSQGVASSGNTIDPSLWAMIVTRLPGFVLDSSFVANKWNEMNQPQYTVLSQILNTIKCSISNGGNPRLIVFAIEAAFEEFQKDDDPIDEADENSKRKKSYVLLMAENLFFSGIAKQIRPQQLCRVV